MKSKERMLTALALGKPDRLPITIHQWQPYHLRVHMGGIDEIEAFRRTGLDASVTPRDIYLPVESPRWRPGSESCGQRDGQTFRRHWIDTPSGRLTAMTGSDDYTTYHVEHWIKDARDAQIILDHWPGLAIDRPRLRDWYDRTGDSGIVRGFPSMWMQVGPWQDFCELTGTQNAILWAVDEPAFVHHFLEGLTRKREAFIHDHMPGLPFDLIECGGGAASSSVISPAMFEEFCLPYDRRINDALHAAGHKVAYHTCGGMMAILDRIPRNGCDASETLSPPAVGGDIRAEQRRQVKETLGRRVALIGGIDQGRLEVAQPAAVIAAEVRACFETFGMDGGFICSASDHFFHAPVANLQALAQAAAECRY